MHFLRGDHADLRDVFDQCWAVYIEVRIQQRDLLPDQVRQLICESVWPKYADDRKDVVTAAAWHIGEAMKTIRIHE